MNKKFKVSPEFIQFMKKYSGAKQTEAYHTIISIYRGRRLGDILVPCGVRAALEASRARKDRKSWVKSAHSRDLFFNALRTLKEPYDDLEVLVVSDQIGFVQPETLVEIIDTINNLKKGIVTRTGKPVEVIYNNPMIIRNEDGDTLIRTMNDITIEGQDEVVILNLRSDTNLENTVASYYVSMLGNLQRYPEKQVTIGTLLTVKSTNDIVSPVYWTASKELLGGADQKWFDTKVSDFVYTKHKSYTKDVRGDLSALQVKRSEKCSTCSYVSFCHKYIATK